MRTATHGAHKRTPHRAVWCRNRRRPSGDRRPVVLLSVVQCLRAALWVGEPSGWPGSAEIWCSKRSKSYGRLSLRLCSSPAPPGCPLWHLRAPMVCAYGCPRRVRSRGLRLRALRSVGWLPVARRPDGWSCGLSLGNLARAPRRIERRGGELPAVARCRSRSAPGTFLSTNIGGPRLTFRWRTQESRLRLRHVEVRSSYTR